MKIVYNNTLESVHDKGCVFDLWQLSESTHTIHFRLPPGVRLTATRDGLSGTLTGLRTGILQANTAAGVRKDDV